MTEFLADNDPGAQKRRSTRISQAVPITVTGVDALGQPFKERTTTVMVNCHGCKYQSKHYVPKNSVVTLEVPRQEAGMAPRSITGRVIWVQRPRTVRELFQIGLEFEVHGNIWGIAFPPEDWFPCAGEEAAAPMQSPAPPSREEAPSPAATQPKTTDAASSAPPQSAATSTSAPTVPHLAKPAPPAPATPLATPTPAVPSANAPAEGKIHLVPAAEPSQPSPSAPAVQSTAQVGQATQLAVQQAAQIAAQQAAQAATQQQISKLLADAKETIGKTAKQDAQAAINDEMTVVRQQLDVQLHDAVERAIKVSMERASEAVGKKLVQQAAERTNAIVEEARKGTEISVVQIDAKIRQAVDQAVSGAAERAAQEAARQAAQLAAAQNLQSSVEQTVARVIAEREAAAPSLSILSSPEAAQQHLDQWKRTLEDTAHGVREAALTQSQSDAEAQALRLHSELEAAINGASQKLGERLDEVSRAKLSETEAEVAARAAGIRAGLDEAVAASQAKIVQAEADANARAANVRSSLDEAVATSQAKIAQAEAEAATRASGIRAGLDEAVAASRTQIAQAEADAQARAAGVRSSLDEAIAASHARISGVEADAAARADTLRASLDQAVAGSQAQIASVEAEAATRAAELRRSLDDAIVESHAASQSLSADIEQERARAGEIQRQLADAAQQAIERTRGGLDELLTTQSSEIARKADEIIAERTARVAPSIENATRQAIEHFSHEVGRTLSPKLDEVGRLADELAQAGQQAATSQQDIRAQMQRMAEQAERTEAGLREQIRNASEQAIADSLSRVREEAAKVPAEVEQACQNVVSRVEAELEKKTTEAQHETYESLSKAADWYQKKAQTTMQSSLEKVVDQSAANLRDRAAEISSLVSTELDHHRRTYAEHSRAEIEETANEIVTRERGRLAESAAMVNAGFTDQVQRVAAESLRRFQEVSREALEKSRSDMEFNREGALTEFQKDLDVQMAKGVQQAQVYLESQLAPLVETWEARRTEQQRQWMELLKRSTEESIEGYKARLENASNSWLLASATTLGQNSQAILDTLAKSAEKRLRDTCSDVLAGIGDTIKDRLMGISTSFSKDAEEDDSDSSPRNK